MQWRSAIPTALVMTLLGLVFPVSLVEAAPTKSTVDYCTISDPRIAEASGLVAAGDHLYVVNDSGDSARVFELNQQCAVSRVITTPQIDTRDVEDLAMDSGGALWLADIGDNNAVRQSVVIDVLNPANSAVHRFRVSYPDGSHNAETLLLDSKDQPVFVTKQDFGNSAVYVPETPLSSAKTTPLRKACDLHFGFTGTSGGPAGIFSQKLATGGAVSGDGKTIAIRTYTDVYIWAAPDKNVEKALCDGKPTRTALPVEKQGEAVTFLSASNDVLTASEGVGMPVHRVSIAAPTATSDTPTKTPVTTPPSQQAAPAPDHPDSRSNIVQLAIIGAVFVGGIGVVGLAFRRFRR